MIFILIVEQAMSQSHVSSFDVQHTGYSARLTGSGVRSAGTSFQTSGKESGTILFIPGFACSGDVFKETRIPYEKDYSCYTLTMAGFAGVQAQENPSFTAWETSIAEFIKDEKINKPILIGHSMGGGLAMAIAADYPALISKIIIIDALPSLGAFMNPTYLVKVPNDCSATITQYIKMTDEQFGQSQAMGLRQLLTDTSKISEVLGWSTRSDRKTFALMYCDFMNTDLREKISSIQCPVLILLEPGFRQYQTAIQEQYRRIKNIKYAYATRGLHFIMYDDKRWYNEQLARFIR